MEGETTLKRKGSRWWSLVWSLSPSVGVIQSMPVDILTCQTNAFRKIIDDWPMVDEHVSIPIDLQTIKGILDVTPDMPVDR